LSRGGCCHVEGIACQNRVKTAQNGIWRCVKLLQ
jgi:hypothetical protein